MANPPITIGPFSNVPAPGSAIASAWAQQITQHVVDRLGLRVFHGNPVSVTLPGGGGTLGYIAAVPIPAVAWNRTLVCFFRGLTQSQSASVDFFLRSNNVDVAAARSHASLSNPMGIYVMPLAANAAGSISVVMTSSAAAVGSADGRFAGLDVLAITAN